MRSPSHAPDDPTIEPAPPSPTAAPTITHSPRFPTHPTPPSTTAYNDSLFTPGSMIAGRYRIVACLGKGGMGEVYRADDLTLGQPVALKFLPPTLAQSPRWMERFRNEVRTARQVAHPNVCRVHDLGEVPGPNGTANLQFLTMEYIDGEDLASLLRRIGRLPRDKAVQLAHQMCAGLAAAHNAGVLHRDLKPANIMIDGRGNAKITDFGIAGLAGQIEGGDVRSGTPQYMSPEQLAGREVTLRSDIYALGLVLYELFTGRRAFKADTATSATTSRTSSELSRPSTLVDDMDPVVERVIMRCLNEDPAQRPSSAMIVAAGLPGGDPLRAALEAGETPSPELVAAAGSDRRVSLRLAVPLLVLSVLCIAGSFVAARWTSLASYLPMPRSPEVLADRAREVIQKLAPELAVKDTASSLTLQLERMADLVPDDKTIPDWSQLRTGRPAVLRYWHRTSPRELAAFGMTRTVGENDPPMDTPGMMAVELDSRGWLTRFRAIPPWPRKSAPAPDAAEREAPPLDLAMKSGASASGDPFDWGVAFQLAGLDIKKFRSAEPKIVPPDFADERFAWDGIGPDSPETPLHVEAASYTGRPTSFRVDTSTEEKAPPAKGPKPPGWYLQYGLQSIFIGVVLFSVWLARRHRMTGRGDRVGAARLATGFFVLSFFQWLMMTHFVADLTGQWTAVMLAIARSLLLASVAWVFYMALEPFVRRHEPHLIVSWTRLVGGRARDPLVGRDALIGFAAGSAYVLSSRASPFLHELVTGRMIQPAPFDVQILGGVLGAARTATNLLVQATISGMIVFFLFFALCTLLRKYRLGIVFFAIGSSFSLVHDPAGSSEYIAVALAIVAGVIFTIGLARVGLLAFMVAIFVINTLWAAPPLIQPDSWSSRGTMVVVLLLVALLAWAYISATGAGGDKRMTPLRPSPGTDRNP